MNDVSETLHSQRERSQLHAQGRRTDESVAVHRYAGRYLAVSDAQVLAASPTAPQRSRFPACMRGAR